MDRGELVPDSVILGIIGEELQQPKYSPGVILDGAVRTVPQAEGLAKLLRGMGKRVAAVLALDVDNEEIVRRLMRPHRLRTMSDAVHGSRRGFDLR